MLRSLISVKSGSFLHGESKSFYCLPPHGAYTDLEVFCQNCRKSTYSAGGGGGVTVDFSESSTIQFFPVNKILGAQSFGIIIHGWFILLEL